jgi:phosphoglucosamine mutase
MLEGGFNFGGEQSGHLVFLDHATTGDGLVAALQVLAVMLAENRPLSELAAILVPAPQKLRSLRVLARPALDDCPRVTAAVAAATTRLGDEGRVLLRYSGTEPKIRIMIEGTDEALIDVLMDTIQSAIHDDIGLLDADANH